MLIVWGWKVRFAVTARGTFFCPQCGGDRPYAQKKGRRWFTLFFLPVVPLNHVGDEFVECDTCSSAYTLRVLQMPTTAALGEQLLAATREAVTWLLRAAGTPTPAGDGAGLDVLARAAGSPWNEQALRSDLTGLDVTGLAGRLAALAPALNENGKETFLTGCALVAAAGGPLTGDGQQMLHQIAASLGMTQAHAHGVISQATDANRLG